MKPLIGLIVIVVLALAASSRRLWRFRRTALGSSVTTGGYLMVLAGVAIGEEGLGLVDGAQVEAMRPLVLLGLGWVGLLVGLGADRRVARALPGRVVGLAVMDGVWSAVIIGGVAAAVMAGMDRGGTDWGRVAAGGALLGVCAIGWAADVRSLGEPGGAGVRVRTVLRAASGVGSILAVLAYGVATAAVPGSGGVGPGGGALGQGLVVLSLGVGTGWVCALLGGELMRLAKRRSGEFLAVLVGLVCLVSGLAAMLGGSAVFVCFVAAAVLVNLRDPQLERFKRVIIDLEQPIAMAVMLAAGLVADFRFGVEGLALVGAVAGARLMVKGVVGRPMLLAALGGDGAGRYAAALLRQSPLAIALALGYAASGRGSGLEGEWMTGARLLGVVIVSGLLVEFVSLTMSGAGGAAAPGSEARSGDGQLSGVRG